MTLSTNIALVEVDAGEVSVGAFSPYDREKHRALSTQHALTHLFRRGANRLESVRFDASGPELGDQTEKRPARSLGGLLNALIETGVGRYLSSSGAKVEFLKVNPLLMVSLEPKNDLALSLFGQRKLGRLPLHVRRGFRIATRPLFLHQVRRCGMVIDAATATQVDGHCGDLLADGFDLTGLYVREVVPSDNVLVRSRRQTIGVVREVRNGRIILGVDRRGEQTEYEPSALFLDPGPASVARLVAHYIGRHANEKLATARHELAAGRARLERLELLRKRLAQTPFEIAPGVRAKVGDWLGPEQLTFKKVRLPRFIVGPGAGTVVDATKAVFREGPRHVPTRVSKGSVEACVICEVGRRQQVEHFLGSLRNGLVSHRALSGTWHIADLKLTLFPAEGTSSAAYESACRQALDNGTKWDLALVQVPDDTRDLIGDANPYLVTKSKFLGRGIPVQEFRDETMKKDAGQLQWALGGIALQVFAKLGGTPWLLQSQSPGVHEVVLGLGSAQLGTGRFGDRERIIGLTTAFSGDGAYWLTEASKVVRFEEHEAAVGASAVAAIDRVRKQMAWKAGDSVRLVVHSFKDFSAAHVEAIQGTLAKLSREGFKVETAFLHVAEIHPILLFDSTEKQRIPPRGVAFSLGDYETVMTALGPDEVRNERLGFPSPLLIKIHRGSTFTNLDYLSQQVLAFASNSWRNFSPTSLPVTILYARLIADLLGRLGNLSRWDPDVLRGSVGETRWFL